MNSVTFPETFDILAAGRAEARRLRTRRAAKLAVWSGVATFVILKLVNLVSPLRASAENENEGLDLVLHGESGYSL